MKFLTYSFLPACLLVSFLNFGSPSALAAHLGLFSQHKDIGLTPKKGHAKFDRKQDEYTVSGGGANIWAKTDAFQYVYKQISGDFTISADIQFEGQGVEQHRKAALMVRQSLTPDSAYADAALHGDGLTSLQYRAAAGGATTEVRSEVKGPSHLQLQRHGNQFTLITSTSATDMKPSGPVTIELQDPVYIGLAVCAHNANVVETAVFSKIAIQPGAPQSTAENFRLLARRLSF